MTALTADLSLTGEIVRVDAPLIVGQFYFLEDEVVLVRGSVTLTYTDVTNGDGWYIDRGQDHSTPATHASGTTFTLAREFATGDGGAIPDPSGAPDGQVPTTESGAYSLLTLPKDFYAQDTDPGAVGSGSVWKDTTVPGGAVWWERNSANDGWNATADQTVIAVVDTQASAQTTASALGGGNANASTTTSAVDGFAVADSGAGSDTGYASVINRAQTNTGMAEAQVVATSNGVFAGLRASIDAGGPLLGFNDASPIAIPELPATPTEQDIADVLVALGLVTQAS